MPGKEYGDYFYPTLPMVVNNVKHMRGERRHSLYVAGGVEVVGVMCVGVDMGWGGHYDP